MTQALAALLPVLIIIAVGWWLRWSGVVPSEQWPGFEAIAYNVFFPSIIIATLVRADFHVLPWQGLGAALFLAIVVMTLICFAVRAAAGQAMRLDGPRFTSVLQGATRWNTFVGLALGATLYGDEGLALMAVAIVAMIPILNVISVGALAWLVPNGDLTAGSFLVEFAKNPFNWSCAVGILINLTGVPIPVPVLTALDLLGQAALAGGVLAVGAGLDLSALRRPGPALTLATLLRLVGMPILAALWCAMFGVTGMALGVAIVATAVPTASGAYLLARKMGGDAKLMAEIITLQTLAAAVTFPLAVGLLGP